LQELMNRQSGQENQEPIFPEKSNQKFKLNIDE